MNETPPVQMPQVVICSSAWKEALAPDDANALIAGVCKALRPQWQLHLYPVSDGGDGWLDAMRSVLGPTFREEHVQVTGPVPGSVVQARYLWASISGKLLLEAAEIHGMRQLPGGIRAPMTATSYGVGEAFRKLGQRHPDAGQLILSVGGSASVDGGLGLLQGLGWEILDAHGYLMSAPMGGGRLKQIQAVRPCPLPEGFPRVTLLVDVETRYADAPAIFGPQKGASPADVASLNESFLWIETLLQQQDLAQMPGTGAAGGLPFGVLLGCPHTTLQPGMPWTSAATGLDAALETADLIITGEGCLDETSLLGKGTGYLLAKALEKGTPMLVLCGQNKLTSGLPAGIEAIPLMARDAAVTPTDLRLTPERLHQVLSAWLSTTGRRLAWPPV